MVKVAQHFAGPHSEHSLLCIGESLQASTSSSRYLYENLVQLHRGYSSRPEDSRSSAPSSSGHATSQQTPVDPFTASLQNKTEAELADIIERSREAKLAPAEAPDDEADEMVEVSARVMCRSVSLSLYGLVTCVPCKVILSLAYYKYQIVPHVHAAATQGHAPMQSCTPSNTSCMVSLTPCPRNLARPSCADGECKHWRSGGPSWQGAHAIR